MKGLFELKKVIKLYRLCNGKMDMVFVVVAFMSLTFGAVNAGNGPGPAPNSGDGIPDGSEFSSPPSLGPNGK
jgi:hypothetical protein